MNETREDFELNMNESNDEQAPNASDSPNGYENADEEPPIDSDIQDNPESKKTQLKTNPLDKAMQAHLFEKTRLVLFNFNPENKESGKEYPAMSGHLDSKDFKVNISAFKKKSRESGRKYLSLSVGSPEHVKVYGRLFRNEAEGKEYEYFGTISKTVGTGQKDENNKTIYRTLWEVQISAKLKFSKSNDMAYIEGDLYIKRINSKERLPPAEALAF
jgi:uncharacterized protein (DUF736 family)